MTSALMRLLLGWARVCYPSTAREQPDWTSHLQFSLEHTRASRGRWWPWVAAWHITSDGWSLRRASDLVRPTTVVDASLLRAAARSMRGAPLFSAALVTIIALGVGTNAAVFSLVQAVVLKPLPYRAPSELVVVQTTVPDRRPTGVTSATLVQWRTHAPTVFTGLAAYALWQGNLDAVADLPTAEGTERLNGALVTPDFFDVLGTTAVAGRVFTQGDDKTSLAVISHRLWARVFGSDPSTIGRPVQLATGVGAQRRTRPYTVIGVLPAGFRFTYPDDTDVWMLQPWAALPPSTRITHHGAVARLQRGVSPRQAEAHLRQHDAPAAVSRGIVTAVDAIADSVHAAARPPLYLLSAIAGVLFIIVCATVAGAQLVRVAERQRELAVRHALGAGRAHIVALLMVEGGLLAVTGVAGGLLLAAHLLPVLRDLAPTQWPRGDELTLSAPVLWFGAGLVGAVLLLGTAVPAWRASRLDVRDALRRAGLTMTSDPTSRRWRHLVIATQAALACALLVAASLLLSSLWQLSQVPLGFTAEGVVTFEMRLLDGRPPEAARRFGRAVAERVRAVTGVTAAGVTSAVPFRGVDFAESFQPEGAESGFLAKARYVDSAALDILGIRLIRGRWFTDRDDASAPPVALVSDRFARRMFGEADPIGQTIDDDAGAPVRRTVIGVVSDVRYVRVEDDPWPAVYRPVAQTASNLLCVVVRTSVRVEAIAGALRRAVADVDPTVAVMRVSSLQSIVDATVADRRFYASVTLVCAGLALVLTLVGIVVVLSRALVERERELAIRASLGARRTQLVSAILRDVVGPVTAGAVAGLAAALGASSIIEQFLFGVSPREPWVVASIGILVVAVAIVTSLVPARRAGAVNATLVLRGD